MSSNTINNIIFVIVSIVVIAGLVLALSLFVVGIDYLDYKEYYNDGYEVRFDFWGYGCEILIEHPTGDRTWEKCSSSAESYVIKNFAVRR